MWPFRNPAPVTAKSAMTHLEELPRDMVYDQGVLKYFQEKVPDSAFNEIFAGEFFDAKTGELVRLNANLLVEFLDFLRNYSGYFDNSIHYALDKTNYDVFNGSDLSRLIKCCIFCCNNHKICNIERIIRKILIKSTNVVNADLLLILGEKSTYSVFSDPTIIEKKIAIDFGDEKTRYSILETIVNNITDDIQLYKFFEVLVDHYGLTLVFKRPRKNMLSLLMSKRRFLGHFLNGFGLRIDSTMDHFYLMQVGFDVCVEPAEMLSYLVKFGLNLSAVHEHSPLIDIVYLMIKHKKWELIHFLNKNGIDTKERLAELPPILLL